MTWYYIKKGLTEDLTVGPIPTGEFLAEVREGKFKPQTLVVSQEETGGQWCELQTVPLLRAAYLKGQQQRQEEKEKIKLEKQQNREREKEARRLQAEQHREELAAKAQEDSVLANQQAKERRVQQVVLERERIIQELHAEPRLVFRRYLMPEYIRALWIIACVVCGFIVFLSSVGGVMVLATNGSYAVGSVLAAIGTVFVAAITLCVVRLVLESFAVFFDIRETLRKQEMILRHQYTHDAE